MDISYLSDYMIPVIVGLCLCVGYVTKKWVKDVDNKFIPTLCAALGVALACWASWPAIDAGTILAGMVSGLASTGLHQAFKQLVGDNYARMQQKALPHGRAFSVVAVRLSSRAGGRPHGLWA